MLAKMKNPFHAQGPSDPRYYADRSELLSFFKQNVMAAKESKGVTKPVNLSIMGRWGIGKTSTLYKFKDILEHECGNARVFSSIIALKPASCTDADTFSAAILESMFSDYTVTAKLPEKIKSFITEEINVLKNWRFSKISAVRLPEIERKQKPRVQAINFKDALVRFWAKLKASNFDLAVIMLDDIHYALGGRPDLLYDLRTDMQALSAQGARYAFIITGPASVYPEMRDKAEPFTRLFEKFNLEAFDINGTRELIQKPLAAENMNLTLSNDVIAHIQEITEGHPYFITLVMRDLLNKRQDGRVTLKVFEGAYPDLMHHFAKVKFEDDFNKATDAEKEILRRMAAAQKEELSPSETGAGRTPILLARLVKKELVIKASRGKYGLYNKLFKKYLQTIKKKQGQAAE